jgi:stringent starvation protein B
MMTGMPPTFKPHLIQAVKDWCDSNQLTPHLAVKHADWMRIPTESVVESTVVLNVSKAATARFVVVETNLLIDAQFGGWPRELIVPLCAVEAIFAKETGCGVSFDDAHVPDSPLSLGAVESALSLSTRARNCLRSDNIYYVADLVDRSERELLTVPNLGRGTLKEIKQALSELGLSLRSSGPDLSLV